MKLNDLSDDELLSGVELLLGSQRRLTALLLSYLAEVEERRLHLLAACSSMFDFCTARLGMSEGEAFRRITGARLARRFSVVLSLVESGKLHLSALCLLRDHLTEQNHRDLLQDACGKTKHQVEALIAARFPKPDVPSSIRKLPEPATHAVSAESTSLPLGSAAGVMARAPLEVRQASVRQARIQPLSAERYKVQFTAGAELKDTARAGEKSLESCAPERRPGGHRGAGSRSAARRV